jgi:hypothetical protein
MNHDKAFERYFIFTADLDFQTKIVMISALWADRSRTPLTSDTSHFLVFSGGMYILTVQNSEYGVMYTPAFHWFC